MEALPEVRENQSKGMTRAEYEKAVEKAKELDTLIAKMLPELQVVVHERVHLFNFPSEFSGLLSTINQYIDDGIPCYPYLPFEKVEKFLATWVQPANVNHQKTESAETKV